MPKYNIPNLRLMSNGKYAYTFHWGYRADGSRHQETRSSFATKREANDDYQKLLVEREATQANKMMATMSLSFGQFVEDNFLPTYRDSVRPQTYRGRVAMIQKHFQNLWKSELSAITPEMVMKWKNQLRDRQSLSNEYVRKICGLCHRIFSLAMDMKLLPTNPAEVLKKTKFLRNEQRTLNFWTLDEFQKVVTSFDQTDTHEVWGLSVLSFLFLSGLRIGEAQALEWKDLDFKSQLVHVTKTMIYHNAHDFHTDQPKTKASIRKVALSADCLRQLERWHECQKHSIGTCRYVFSTTGIPMNRTVVERLIRRKAMQAMVPIIRIHDLRHSHASLLIEQGANPLLVRDRLGHSDVKITLQIYGHMYPNRDKQLAQLLDGLVILPAVQQPPQELDEKNSQKEGEEPEK